MACIALPIFQHLEANASAAVARVDRVKGRHFLAGLLCAPMMPSLAILSRELRKGIQYLNSEESDRLSVDELRQVAHQLNQVHGKLRKLLNASEVLGLRRLPLYRHFLDEIDGRTDHLGSIAEGLYMSLNADFREALVKTAEELEHLKNDSSRSPLIEQMHS